MQSSLHNPGYALRQSSGLYAPSTFVRAIRSGILSIPLYTDIAAAMVLIEQTVGRNTPMYAATELMYARLLHATGANVEATRTEAEAKALLEAIHQQQCDTCSISAAGLR